MTTQRKKIAFHTLGCKLNFSETSTISRQFGDDDYEHVSFDAEADIYVINSCTVTGNAEKRCKGLIRQAMRKNPDAFVVVAGCYSQIKPQELMEIPGVGLVLGTADKFNLFEHIKNLERLPESNQAGKDPSLGEHVSEPDIFVPSWSADDRTRTFFKIQDGCDYFCTYCTIPLARGRSRSDTIQGTLKTAQKIASSGIREMVLSGVNIGDFGRHHKESFYDLLKGLVSIPGIDRIRISSVEPDLLHKNIIELVADTPKLMPHFHIPLQSGSDRVLKDMGRKYDTALFADRVAYIRALMPHACIAADLIVGFPTETAALFEESRSFIHDHDISYVHVFTYSERDNTRAYKSAVSVPPRERTLRSAIMHSLSDEKKKYFYLSNKGRQETVLWEQQSHQDSMHGFTENYIKVKTHYRQELVNTLSPVVLNKLDDDGVYMIS